MFHAIFHALLLVEKNDNMHIQTEICCVKGDDLIFCTKYFHSDMKVSRDAIVAVARSGLNVRSISKRLKVH